MLRKFANIYIKYTKEKQSNCNFILQNYFAFLIIKDKFRQNI